MNTQEKLKVGLIGNGHFGKAFASRLVQSGAHAEIAVSQGHGKNVRLAQESDLLVLAVRPLQLAEVADEIRGYVQGVLLTFSAATPKEDLESKLDHPVVRAMADIDFTQVLSEKNDGARDFLSALSQNPLIEVEDEMLLEAHTIFVGCLPGVIAWQLLHNKAGATQWLQEYFAFIEAKLGVKEEVLQKILYKGLMDEDPASTVKRVATTGGITESLLQRLGQNPATTLDELYAAGWARTLQVRERVGQSLRV